MNLFSEQEFYYILERRILSVISIIIVIIIIPKFIILGILKVDISLILFEILPNNG